ncbi:MAG TPA: carboxymuconolactone decarboxylase family protein [Actinomycetes bacterium]|nr:carboxymuconolactone decarboxylase family protein [Actinomycetes bacterium]
MNGEEIRRLIMGKDWVSAAPGGDEDALAQFSSLAIEHVWNAFWARDGLELRLRSAVTIAALVALEAGDELVAHVGGALRAKVLTGTEIREAVLQLAPYLGYPRVRHALVAVAELLDADSRDQGSEPA